MNLLNIHSGQIDKAGLQTLNIHSGQINKASQTHVLGDDAALLE